MSRSCTNTGHDRAFLSTTVVGAAQPHDPGVVLAQLAVMLADGGDCFADIAALHRQPELLGRVGSDPTVWRVLDSIHSLGLRKHRGGAGPACTAGAAPENIVIDIDFDGTLLDAHSDK